MGEKATQVLSKHKQPDNTSKSNGLDLNIFAGFIIFIL